MLNGLKKDKYEIISFDIFDTLVNRIFLSSEDVFEIVRRFYIKRYGGELDDFVSHRMNTEHSLWKRTEAGVFTLDNIYCEMKKYYPNDTCEKLKEIELEIEGKVILINQNNIAIYNEIVDRKKILISDMYLERKYLEKILSQLGIKNYAALYISGEQKAAKYNGKIFKIIGDNVGGKNEILHCGDSFRGDFIMPRLSGWSSCWIKKYRNPYIRKYKKYSMSDSLLVGLLNNRFLYNEYYYTNIGYAILGPLLYCYVRWIETQLRENCIGKVVFLARDGWCVKKAFDYLFADTYETEYMYVSRKSAVNAVSNEAVDVNSLLHKYKFRNRETLESVLLKLGVDDIKDVQKIEISRNKLYMGAYNHLIEPYFKEIQESNETQRQFLVEYVGNLFDRDEVAVVDVGWHGTIQDCIKEICKDNVCVRGLYLGLEDNKQEYKHAFLNDSIFDANMIPFIRGIVETFFTAPHPSTIKYVKSNDIIKPVFSNNDEKLNMTIQHIHDGAMQFLKEYVSYAAKLDIEDDINVGNIQRMFIEFCLNPSKKDIGFIKDLKCNDVTNSMLLDYQKGKIKHNFSTFLESDWKAAHAKMLFKLPVSYGRIFVKINRIRKMVVKPKWVI